MELRPATEADIPGIRRLYVELHEYSAERMPSRLKLEDDYDEEKQVAYARKLISGDTSSCCLLALDGDAPVGLAEVHIREPEIELGAVPVRRGHLQSLVVTADARRRGVGSALLDAAERWAREHDAAEMELDHWVFAGDPGAFYEQAGYRLISAMRVKPLL